MLKKRADEHSVRKQRLSAEHLNQIARNANRANSMGVPNGCVGGQLQSFQGFSVQFGAKVGTFLAKRDILPDTIDEAYQNTGLAPDGNNAPNRVDEDNAVKVVWDGTGYTLDNNEEQVEVKAGTKIILQGSVFVAYYEKGAAAWVAAGGQETGVVEIVGIQANQYGLWEAILEEYQNLDPNLGIRGAWVRIRKVWFVDTNDTSIPVINGPDYNPFG